MKIPNLLSFLNKSGRTDEIPEETADESMGIMPSPKTLENEENISRATKIKVISAFLLVGFAFYAANWIQSPDDIRADVLAGTEEIAETEGEMLAETDPAAEMAAETPEMPAEETLPAEEVLLTEDTMSEEEPLLTEEPLPTEEAMPAEGGLTQEVSIIDFNYNPLETTIPAGGTVIWTNKDAVPHTVSGLDFTSGVMNPGDSFSYLFDTDGTYEYACSLHPQMKGKIIVGSGESALVEQPMTEEVVDYLPLEGGLMEEQPLAEAAEPEFGAGGEEPLVTSADLALAHGAAAEQFVDAGESKNIAQSGPEDLLYLGIFGFILYLRRKKVLSMQD